MARPTDRGDQIKRFILENTPSHPGEVVSFTAQEFGITRQAINRYIRDLIADGLLSAEGKTKQRKYSLVVLFKEAFEFKLDGLREDVLWRDTILPLLNGYSENVIDIWHYGCTEMINNAIDHSEGTRLFIFIGKDAVKTSIWIDDNGVGIFKKIKEACNLDDERHAVLELSKGKLTTDPDNHTGEGIFFSSRMFDHYIVFSGDVTFSHDYDFDEEEEEDWIWEREARFDGTQVLMSLMNDSDREQRAIYDKYTATDDDFGFTKTVVPVRLAKHGHEKLISRSQAKRLMARVDRFKVVILDFSGVEVIGQAFADEIFRVFVNHHPDVTVRAAHANKDIQKMIKKARSNI
jgi:hypothetical protein